MILGCRRGKEVSLESLRNDDDGDLSSDSVADTEEDAVATQKTAETSSKERKKGDVVMIKERNRFIE